MPLFEDQSETPPIETPATRVVGVHVAAAVWRAFDYAWPDAFPPPQAGQRVRVPFGRGNRPTIAFIAFENRPAGDRKLKAVAEIIDSEPLLDASMLKLGEWIQQYYLAPPGMTFAAMIPSAVGRHAAATEAVATLLTEGHRDWPANLGSRQKRVLDELYESRKQGVEGVPLELLMHASGATRESIQRLARRELLRIDHRPVILPDLSEAAAPDNFELNEDQSNALAELERKLSGGFSVTLLHGVTGSGKTEVYVRLIRRCIEMGRQAILLTPEIALATQTLLRLLQRLPRVAVLHSGLTDAQRAFYYQQIRDGHAHVVVGPRSAVFAPARKLGLILVDEEHEPSYKQDAIPRYHGRDVAVMRASLAGVPVVLGTATPSMESLHNVQLRRYALLKLPHRVRGLPMPKLQIVNLRQEATPGRIELLGRTLTQKMAATLDRREQILLLMNRRGYASYVFCPGCKWLLCCDHCTRAMVFHQATQMALCHYCDHTVGLPEACPACGKKLLLFGYGIQRIESEMARKFPAARVARMDSDTMTSPRQFQKVLDEFGRGDVDILLGTQMIAKGLDFPRVSLVGVVSADTSLAIPDFRAAERTFQLIVQVAGRAGRSDLPGEVVVQTLNEHEPAIQFATTHDYDGFASGEIPLRKEAGYPPFARLVRFIIRHTSADKAQESANTFVQRLRKCLPQEQIRIRGPQVAGVAKISNLFRFELLVLTSRPGVVQQAVFPRMEELTKDIPAEIVADADPMALL
jgi:primosomal protein N' (replication factor Y)